MTYEELKADRDYLLKALANTPCVNPTNTWTFGSHESPFDGPQAYDQRAPDEVSECGECKSCKARERIKEGSYETVA